MVMNLYILFFVSLPDAVLNSFILLLFIGEKDKLKINAKNILRFTGAIALMITASWFIRPISGNVAINMTLHNIAYVIIFFGIYRLNIVYSALGVVFSSLVHSALENLYIPYIIAYAYKGMEAFSQDYHMYVLYSLPKQIVQVLIIKFLWNNEILLITKINKYMHKIFVAFSFVLIFIEWFFVYIFYTYSNRMILYHQIIFSLCLLCMVILFNLLTFKLIYISIKGVVTKGYIKYTELEENTKFMLEELNQMLKANRVDKALKLINELKGNDS